MENVAHWLESLGTEGSQICSTPAVDLARPVPTCPDWTVRDLVVHIGAVHRWAARHVAEPVDSTVRFGFDTSDVPDGDAVVGWYADRLRDLCEVLRDTDPDRPVRAFGRPGLARFWFRRQAHETAVHRWDLQNASEAGPSPIDAALAVDGIAEWFEVFVPRVLRRADLPEGAVGTVVGVRPDDADGHTVRLASDGATTEPHARPDVVVRGSASDILLGLWRRIPMRDLTVDGDTPTVDALLDVVRV
ncbi:maleylpyruvate isomerase family mycothiol-dependent enzyme [Gordonia humi]|uniref:Uncharacterized protein (TIGR03083 family) n=1 Tax=Gordonia humi TaxID=686429 RepID=A0A840F3I6_9ACTN|nr:maleylpyruvate isomerase family mycothiol-dependent enzyme [Gordonia humi]MBB4137204.1 uncharacterized protein (TIGR03083 family) [Gordonia humi]